VDFVVCTLAVKKRKIRAGFDLSDRTIPLLDLAVTVTCIHCYYIYIHTQNDVAGIMGCITMRAKLMSTLVSQRKTSLLPTWYSRPELVIPPISVTRLLYLH
jgi:hypothetical protein